VRSIGLREDLERAIRRQEFELHYEPIVDIATGDLAGVEALVRWRHPTRGLLQPAEFIAVAESTGSIVALGQWIFAQACRQAIEWSSGPLADGRFMSVNLSTVQLTHPDFLSFVTDALRAAKLAPGRLMVEVTESANSDAVVVAETLRRVHGLGIRLAIDDFGIGYNSLGRLPHIPFEIIKIDRSLVDLVDTESRGESVVTGITDLARRLGATTVAEGVERAEQLVRLRQMGCQMAQGFHFSAALPAAEFEALLGRSGSGVQARLARRVPHTAT
jgi:EAL domain-containing protein (putative c-di-GMP-specific phosphodiesterase class I)